LILVSVNNYGISTLFDFQFQLIFVLTLFLYILLRSSYAFARHYLLYSRLIFFITNYLDVSLRLLFGIRILKSSLFSPRFSILDTTFLTKYLHLRGGQLFLFSRYLRITAQFRPNNLIPIVCIH